VKYASWLVPAVLGILPAALCGQPIRDPFAPPAIPAPGSHAMRGPGYPPRSFPSYSYQQHERHNPHDGRFGQFPHGGRTDFLPHPRQQEFFWFQRPYPFHFDYYRMRYGGSYEPYFGNLYGPPVNFNSFYQPPFFGP
jgi:hypothetical protein